jgi:hypothetical protein
VNDIIPIPHPPPLVEVRSGRTAEPGDWPGGSLDPDDFAYLLDGDRRRMAVELPRVLAAADRLVRVVPGLPGSPS